MIHFSRSFVIESTLHDTRVCVCVCVVSGRDRSYPDRIDEFQREHRDKFEQMRTAPYHKKRQGPRERKRKRERDLQ